VNPKQDWLKVFRILAKLRFLEINFDALEATLVFTFLVKMFRNRQLSFPITRFFLNGWREKEGLPSLVALNVPVHFSGGKGP
jgi:hypothetical protein